MYCHIVYVIFKGFYSILQDFYIQYFEISFYSVDIPEFIFWMKLWILWKDTDVSFFFDCSMFLVSNKSDVSIRAEVPTHMKTHTKKVHSSSLFRFFKRVPAKKLLGELKPIKRNSHSKSACGTKHCRSHLDLHKSYDLQLRLSHQKMFPSSTKTSKI